MLKLKEKTKKRITYYKHGSLNKKKPDVHLYVRSEIWSLFQRLAKTVEMPVPREEMPSRIPRNRILFQKIFELYKVKLAGSDEFVVDDKPARCNFCNKEASITEPVAGRRKRTGGRVPRSDRSSPTLNSLGRELHDEFYAVVAGRNKTSDSNFFSAMVLTYHSEKQLRPAVFCDTCLLPVNSKFPYADKRLQALAYLFTPWDDGPVTYLQYGHEKPEILVKRGHLNVSYNGSTVARLLGKIEHNKSFTEDDLGKALAEINPQYKIKKVFGEGLVQLSSGLFLVSCPCKKPSFV